MFSQLGEWIKSCRCSRQSLVWAVPHLVNVLLYYKVLITGYVLNGTSQRNPVTHNSELTKQTKYFSPANKHSTICLLTLQVDRLNESILHIKCIAITNEWREQSILSHDVHSPIAHGSIWRLQDKSPCLSPTFQIPHVSRHTIVLTWQYPGLRDKVILICILLSHPAK